MHIYYINRKSDLERKKAFLSAAEAATNEDVIERINALEPPDIKRLGIRGAASEKEKSLYLSHVKVLEKARQLEQPFLVLEDDTKIERENLKILKQLPHRLNAQRKQWDIIFGEVLITTPKGFIEFQRIKNSQINSNHILMQSLNKQVFAGTSSMLINNISIKKIHGLLKTDGLNAPIDMKLRSLIHRRILTAYVPIPYLTTTNRFADESTIQDSKDSFTVKLWNLCRESLYRGSSNGQLNNDIHEFTQAYMTQELSQAGKLLAGYIAKQFIHK